MLRYETAGESHGECLVATLTGLPSGVPIDSSRIDRELWRRQQGFGRGGRMKIETDTVHFVSGVRHSHTIGSPIAILLANKDWKNWTEALGEGRAMRVYFDHVGGGLTAKGGSLKGFEVAGADGHFEAAQATIDGETVVVSAPGVARPMRVRYAWANDPPASLFNTEGLPASPFQSN